MASQQSAGFKKSGDQFSDMGAVAKKYIYHWPLFLLGLMIAAGCAYLYMQIANPIYQVSATILVKDEKKSPQEKSALQELDQSGSPKIAEAEIEILKSKKLISQVVNDLNLWVNYAQKDRFTSTDLYKSGPFTLVPLNKPDLGSAKNFKVLVKNDKSFEFIDDKGAKQTGSFDKPFRYRTTEFVLKPTKYLPDFTGSTITLTISSPERVSADYAKAIDVRLLDKSAPTIGLFISDAVPQRGKDFLNNLISEYNSATSAEEQRNTKRTIDFIDKRLASLTGELNSAEKEVEGFRSSQGLTDITSQSKVYLENVQSNDTKLNEVNVQLNIINGIERYVNSSSSSENAPATIGITDPALNSLIEKLSQLQLKRAALLATTPENNPIFEPIDRQIRITKSAIKQNISNIKTSLLNTKRELQSFNNKFESSIKNIPGQERQFISMKRQQAIKENLYVYLLQKREELSLSYAATLVDARIVDNANTGDIIWPRTSLIIAISLLAGLGIPFLILFFRNSFNSKITNRKDIEEVLGVRLLGELSYEDHRKNIIVLDETHHIVGEQFRSLRTNLHYLHNNKKGRGRVTLFTSSVSNEGKSFVSSNIAASLSASGRKVIILELDLRKPKLMGIFDIKSEKPGISDFLSSDLAVNDIIQNSGISETLDVISAGHLPPNPSELLEKYRLDELINHLREVYDDIIIDSPPVHLVTDAMLIGRVADVTLYIVKQGFTSKQELGFISEIFEGRKLPNINIVFNGIKKGKYGYGYNYDNSYYSVQTNKMNFNKSLRLFFRRF